MQDMQTPYNGIGTCGIICLASHFQINASSASRFLSLQMF